MSTNDAKAVDLQEGGQNRGGEACVVSRRTLIKAAWTVPVIAATITPSSVFAGCSNGTEAYTPVGCARSAGFYDKLKSWLEKDGLIYYNPTTIAGYELTRDQILYILNNDSQSQNAPFVLFRQLVATRISTEHNQSTRNWSIDTAYGTKTIDNLMNEAEAMLAAGYTDKSGATHQYITFDGKVPVTDGESINTILEANGTREMWTDYNEYLAAYINSAHCPESGTKK